MMGKKEKWSIKRKKKQWEIKKEKKMIELKKKTIGNSRKDSGVSEVVEI